jgi:hypothetical protein
MGRTAPVYYEHQALTVRLDANNHATQAYYIHSGYCTMPWSAVASVESHPVASSADGTHASYPTGGGHDLDRADRPGPSFPRACRYT